MASIPLIALKTMHYAGRLVLAGQPFTASSDQDARILTRLGRAKKASVPAGTYCVGFDGPDGVDGVDGIPVDQPRKKRTYRRRDLTAESSE